MNESWRDPAQYKKGRLTHCLNCGVECHRTKWGAWCYPCNVKRIENINASFEKLKTKYDVNINKEF